MNNVQVHHWSLREKKNHTPFQPIQNHSIKFGILIIIFFFFSPQNISFCFATKSLNTSHLLLFVLKLILELSHPVTYERPNFSLNI